jgi:hypothetical protein
LVERLLCKQDVSGSSPLTSICEKHRSKEKRIQHLLKNNLLKVKLQKKNLENCIYNKIKSGSNFRSGGNQMYESTEGDQSRKKTIQNNPNR